VFLAVAALAPGVGRAAPASAVNPAQDTETVVVTLRSRADLDGLHATNRRARLRKVVGALRTTAQESQAPLLTDLSAAVALHQARVDRTLWVSNSVVVTATPDVIRSIAARPDVARVQPDAIDLVPAALAPAAANQVAVHAPDVWSAGDTGQGVVVATLDSGVDASHPDLSGSWRGGGNSWYDPYGQHPTDPIDLTGHGTAVTGVLVGRDGSGETLGTAPDAQWIAARVFDDVGGASLSAVHAAFQWVLDPDGDPSTADAPQVVNASWSLGAGPSCDLSLQSDVVALREAGILPVFAAGNFGPGANSAVSPANYPEALSVGALGATSAISAVSSRGPSGCGGRNRPFPDLVAPGEDVFTTDRWGLYQYASGTSVAAPHVAGALALLLSAHRGLSADQQRDLVTASATDLGEPGADDVFGYGLVDVAAAVAALPPAPADFAVSLTPETRSVAAGHPGIFQVNVSSVDGFDGDVTLALSGPARALGSASVTPTVVAGGSGSATVTVATAAQVRPGRYGLTVTASGAGLSRSAEATLQIVASAPQGRLIFSTHGRGNPPGVGGDADDADLFAWDGSAYARAWDASNVGVGATADLDGLDVVDATHFYVSTGTDTRLPGLGKVKDEDVLYYNDGSWSVFFDGAAHGLRSARLDIDAISISGRALFFSTHGVRNPPGVRGRADDADIYAWNGKRFRRVWDASAHGVPDRANVDGFSRIDARRFYVSFGTARVRLRGLGAVQDEDVVHYDHGTWSAFFDGTAHGLRSARLDVDAFDLT
jgi:subtilisin family serine protease